MLGALLNLRRAETPVPVQKFTAEAIPNRTSSERQGAGWASVDRWEALRS